MPTSQSKGEGESKPVLSSQTPSTSIKDDPTVLISGWLKKQGSRMPSLWKERFFVLRGYHLSYYLKEIDLEPKASFLLNPYCSVSQVRTTSDKKHHSYFIFEVLWPKEEVHEDEDADGHSVSSNISNSSSSNSIDKHKLSHQGKQRSFHKPKKDSEKEKKEEKASKMSNIKVAALAIGGVIAGTLTSGIGLLAGMTVIGMGAAAGSGAVALSQSIQAEYSKQLVCACDTFEEATRWAQLIKAQIRELNDDILGGVLHPSALKSSRESNIKSQPPPEVRFQNVENWARSDSWKLYNVCDGIRIFEHKTPTDSNNVSSDNNSNNNLVQTCLRINISTNGSLVDTFMAIMNMGSNASCKMGIIKSVRTVENIDNYTDVIHLILEPMPLGSVSSNPRDFCLLRYWKQNSDGCYVVIMNSISHQDCPLVTGYVRGEMQAAYIISPPLEDEFEEDQTECMISFIAQCDPKGWIWNNYGFQEKFLEGFMLHVLDFRDIIDSERFIQTQLESLVSSDIEKTSIDENETNDDGGCKIGSMPPPLLPQSMWGNINEDNFKVRGKSYIKDKIKVKSAGSMFKLVAVDLIETAVPDYNVAAHPRNRVRLAHERGEKFWCFIVNLMIPGTPNLNLVSYFLGDKTIFEKNTPFAKIGKQFFFGNDDDYRNRRFKLIPKVVEGNFIVRNAVQDTPAILGMKLTQYYKRDDHYFELAIDVGSSSIAKHTTGLAQGFSKQLIVDMAYCLEGKEEDELPEVLMGGFSCIHVDLATSKKM